MAQKMHSYIEVEKHNKKGDCWIIIFGKVYNVSQFVDHPGGPEILLMATGRDAADDFEVVKHSPEAREKMKEFYIGDIDTSTYPKLKTYGKRMVRNTYTFQEVKKHNTEDDCWIIISNKVFDVTRFLEHHPGGSAMLLMATGKDATYDYEVVEHSRSAREKVNDFYIGDIDPSTLPKPIPKPKAFSNNLLTLVFIIGVAVLMYYLT